MGSLVKDFFAQQQVTGGPAMNDSVVLLKDEPRPAVSQSPLTDSCHSLAVSGRACDDSLHHPNGAPLLLGPGSDSVFPHLSVQRVTPDKIYHVTVMPCYDKKLEASRPDFFRQEHQTRDVDCVITTGVGPATPASAPPAVVPKPGAPAPAGVPSPGQSALGLGGRQGTPSEPGWHWQLSSRGDLKHAAVSAPLVFALK